MASRETDRCGHRTRHEQVLREAQNLFLGQTALLMKTLTWMLPFSRSHRRDGE